MSELSDPVEEFYRRVNERAEQDMLRGNPVTGAHHRALEAEIKAHRNQRGEPRARVIPPIYIANQIGEFNE